jgi:hypothetical protein
MESMCHRTKPATGEPAMTATEVAASSKVATASKVAAATPSASK